MATFKFYLKPANKKKLYPIMLCYQDKGKKFRYFTKLFTSKSTLIADRINKPSSLQEMEVNEKLLEFSRLMYEVISELHGWGCTVEKVEKLFRHKMAAKQERLERREIISPTKQSDFFRLYDQFVDQNRSIKSRSTIYHYQICKKTLLAFEKFTSKPITFEKINNQFYQLFQNYLITERKYLNNTVGGHIKNFKVFLNYAVRNGFTDVQF